MILFYLNDFNYINNNIKKIKKENFTSYKILNDNNSKKDFNENLKIPKYKSLSNSTIQIERVNSNSLINNKKEIGIKYKYYLDYELNLFNYNNALKYDKRTILKYYFSLLKQNHLLILLFYENDYFNSIKIKINLILFSFSLFYLVNTLFFTDKTMSKIFERKINYNFIPQIIYSTIISHFISNIIKNICLSKTNLLEIKKESELEKIDYKIKKYIKYLKIRFCIFFFICFILLIIFWIYIATFCAIYENTQIYPIINTLISFFLFLISPFILYLFSGFIRIESIKNKGKFLYILSKLIQYI